MWEQYYTAGSIDDVLEILDREGPFARIIAGGTDLVLELKNGIHPEIKSLIDINRIENLDFIEEKNGQIFLGPTVTHNQCLVSELLINNALPLVKAAQSIGAPQIRNVGTVLGNLITASPANDTIAPLIALDAELTIRSKKKERKVKLADFYKGVRKIDLANDEMVMDVHFNKMLPNQKGSFIKYLLRQTHAISVANAVVLLTFDEKEVIRDAKITLGAVAPTIVRAKGAETYLVGKTLSNEVIEQASKLAAQDGKPISDVRASEEYRDYLIPVLVEKALIEILNGDWNKFDRNPILLWGKEKHFFAPTLRTFKHDLQETIKTRINGKDFSITNGQNQTLVNLIREYAGLTGTKIGCGEGECGACTLYMNGLPVFSCLIPAPRAHQCDITTIEGISDGVTLHPVQQAFIDEGAVQCGYCTPGFIMSAVKLLEEKPHPNETEIKQGLAGNICRCTGYYSIISAVEKAAENMAGD
jgi:xanthine dehydrogenase iron-sulfur cluster and FAD-binding subunit A